MSTEPARRTIRWSALAIGVFALAWAGLHVGFYQRVQMIDTPIYQGYGDAIVNTTVPYRDFGLEYPPAALPMFAIPALLNPIEGDLTGYARRFDVEMLVCGCLMLVAMAATLVRLGAGRTRLASALGFTALSPLLLGSVVLSRFDLWPAALTAAALAAFVWARPRLGAGILGVAFAAKLYPAVFAPVAVIWVWRRVGRREAVITAAVFAGTAALCFAPFVLVAPHGVLAALLRQTNRPLQIESLGSAVLLVVHTLTGLALTMRSGWGSQNLVGALPDGIARIQTALQLAAIVGVWIWYLRMPGDEDRLIRGWAAAVCAFIALAKVLSPQYMLWLIPLVPLVRGRRGVAASGVLAAALVLTQSWFPAHYWQLTAFKPVESWLVLSRDLAVIALLVVLLAPDGRRGHEPRPAGNGP